MSLSRIFFAATTAALLATSAYAETPAEAATHMPPPAENGMGMGGHGGGGMRHFLSDEERMMFMIDMHKAIAGMTDDQKQAYREQQRARFVAMSEADRAKFKADLDNRWAALPADQKAQVRALVAARMAAHPGGAAPQ